MTTVKLTRYIIQSLKDEGTSHIFMIPGGYVDNFSLDIVEVNRLTALNFNACTNQAREIRRCECL